MSTSACQIKSAHIYVNKCATGAHEASSASGESTASVMRREMSEMSTLGCL
jgi:hypothetical protein